MTFKSGDVICVDVLPFRRKVSIIRLGDKLNMDSENMALRIVLRGDFPSLRLKICLSQAKPLLKVHVYHHEKT
jgi:hypothetical protein